MRGRLAHGEGRFVGRARELRVLRDLLARAVAGRGGAVALSGEAGIGKTWTAEALAAEAGAAGVRTLWGRCYDASWSRPFAPWAEAVEPLASPPPWELVRSSAQVSAEEARLHIHEEFAQLLRGAADEGLLVVLDDVHAADDSSIELLRYLGRGIATAPILLVLTYRDDEVDSSHRLAHALAELERAGSLHRIALAAFRSVETAELLAILGGTEVSSAVVEAVQRETAGNPFFVHEVARGWVEAGHDLGAAEAPRAPVPESVRHAVGLRVARLAPQTQRLLAVAAAFEQSIGVRELQSLTGLGDEELLACLDEALRGHVLRATGEDDRYEFAHALVRHALYEDASPSRRVRLHRRVAVALERAYAGREDEHAAEIAGQYARSASLPGAAHGVQYALAAADQARRAHAYAEAAMFLQTARELASGAAPALRAAILTQLAIVEAQALLHDSAEATIDEALSALEEGGSGGSEIAEFLAEAVWALKDAGAPESVLAPLVGEGLELLGEVRDLTWARLKLALRPVERASTGSLRYGRWRGFDAEAVEIARARGSEEDYARTLTWFGLGREDVDDLLERVRTWPLGTAKNHALHVAAQALLYGLGEFAASEAVAKELVAAGERAGSVFGHANGLLLLAEIGAARGDFASARTAVERADDLLARLGPEHRLRMGTSNAEEYLLLFVGGDWRPLADAYARLATDPSFAWPWLGPCTAAVAALGYARCRSPTGADRMLDLAVTGLGKVGVRHPTALGALHWAVAAAWELDRREWARDLARLARRSPADLARDRAPQLTEARTAALAGEHDTARKHFSAARAALDANGQRPFRAIVDYDEALALHRAGEPGAEPLLHAARAQFAELGMTWWLQRTDELAQQVATRPAFPDGLTAREVEVLRLLAGGARNKEIADELVVSVHTVERHLANIYSKIDARNRADATAYALSAGL